MAWIEHEDLGPSPMSVMSSNPEAIAALRDLHKYVTFGGSVLTRVQEETIATNVAVINKCRY